MFAFRSAIRRLFGISIPGIDSSLDVTLELRSALEEAEAEIVELEDKLFIEQLFAALSKAQLVKSLGDIMIAYGIDSIELVADEDEEVDFD